MKEKIHIPKEARTKTIKNLSEFVTAVKIADTFDFPPTSQSAYRQKLQLLTPRTKLKTLKHDALEEVEADFINEGNRRLKQEMEHWIIQSNLSRG